MVQFLPAVRLNRLAQQLLQLQPHPPRDLSFATTWSVYAPLVVYQEVGLALLGAIVVAVTPGRPRATLTISFVVLLLLQLVFWLWIATRLRSSLTNGVEATAVVVRMGSAASIPRAEVNGHVTPLRGATTKRVRVGDRIRVLTNPAGDRIWISLESLTT